MLRRMHAIALALTMVTALRVPGPLSPRNASYQLKATLDPDKHEVLGHERITWRNVTTAPATQLVFHLYMNAFKNEASTFYRESHGRLRFSEADKHGWGAIDVSKIVIAGQDATARFKVDDTLATVELAQPIAPGASVEIDVDWKTLLPKVFARTGYHEQFFAITQWFPKIGVWDCDEQKACRWRAHQHHANSEFFADYGVYDVEVDVPQRFVVAASGVPVGERASGDRKVLSFHAEDVHDFAIFAFPKFVVHEDRFTDTLGDVKILLYAVPGHEANVPRHLAAAKAGLAEMTRRFGPYPYARLSIIDIPTGAEGAGGMEYPTLITTFDAPVPAGMHLPELVTAHEFAHQYFYGMVGSDEVEEAWLDEGFTDTSTDYILERMFGPTDSEWRLAGHHLSATEAARLSYRGRADLDPLETRAYAFVDRNAYGAVTYSKTVVTLRTLEALLGKEKFEAAMRHYFETWRFRHPRIDDFVKTFDEGAGRDLTWYWTPLLRGTETLDYEVLSIDVRPKRTLAGLFEKTAGDLASRHEVEPPKHEKTPYTSEVVVHRRGELMFPVELKVVFSDGSEKHEQWDGGRADGLRWHRFTYEGEHKVVSAEIDPAGKVPLDLRRLNNGLRTKGDGGPRRRVAGLWEQLVSTVLAMVGF
jgi:hypothetical protein